MRHNIFIAQVKEILRHLILQLSRRFLDRFLDPMDPRPITILLASQRSQLNFIAQRPVSISPFRECSALLDMMQLPEAFQAQSFLREGFRAENFLRCLL